MLRDTWSAMVAYLNRRDDDDLIFVPDPSLLFLLREQCRSLETTGPTDIQEVLGMMLGALRLWARAHRTGQRSRCVYRILAKLDSDVESGTCAVKLELRHINSGDDNFCRMSLFDDRRPCPLPLFGVSQCSACPHTHTLDHTSHLSYAQHRHFFHQLG